MPRYIDADELMRDVEKAENSMEYHGQEFSYSFLSSGQEISTEWYFVENLIESAPTADVVEVVRCGKCCFAKPFNDVWFQPKRDTLWCSVFMEERETEWFCANGERRTDETG